jgi:hypothetical protein
MSETASTICPSCMELGGIETSGESNSGMAGGGCGCGHNH